MSLSIVILAAGKGRRMRSDLPKPLLPLGHRPLLAHILESASSLCPRRIVVVAPPDNAPLRAVAESFSATVVEQPQPRGTADAAKRALQKLPENGWAIILCADTPLLRTATIRRLAKTERRNLSLLSFTADDPTGYGRIIRHGAKVVGIVEEKDADAHTRKLNEVYAGALGASVNWLKKTLPQLNAKNATKEFYLTDLVAVAVKAGRPVATVRAAEEEARGINTPAELAAAAAGLRRRNTDSLLARGVRLADPQRVDVRGIVTVGRDVEIDINAVFIGRVSLGRGSRIGANCVIIDSAIGADAVIEAFCHLHNAKVGARCRIGPYARLRPGAELQTAASVGNFVEIKKTRLGKNSKAGHLAYLGDSKIGEGVNIGAGTITCNYDGQQKHRTFIGDDVFIGSGTQLVAPVKIGKGAYIAAGSTITKDAPQQKLSIARTRQIALPLGRRGKK